jgi:Type IV secretion system pilin
MITSIQDLISAVGNLLSIVLPLASLVALLFFVWGLATFILHADDAKAHEEGKNKMLWGVIALFVMVSIWGIIRFFQVDFFGGSPTSTVQVNNPPTY